MLNGIYSVQFRSGQGGEGSGTAIFIDGRIYGGDHLFFYKGAFSVNENQVAGQIQVTRHQQGDSIFGPLNDFTLELTGTAAERISLTGNVVGQPGLTIRIEGHKVSAL